MTKRKKYHSIILLFALMYLLLLFPTNLSAATNCQRNYYISTIGNDLNDGLSIAKAWRTLEKTSKVSLKGGDCIFLEGGKTFEGMVWFDSTKDTSSATSKITLSTFGISNSTISAVNRPGIYIHNIGNINIENINIIANGALNNTLNGISITNDFLYGGKIIENYNINNVNINGFGNFGLDIGSYVRGNSIKNILISNSSFSRNGRAGLITHGSELTSIQNIVIDKVTAFDNHGIPNKTYNTGDGIVLSHTYGGRIMNSRVYNNGQYCSASNCSSGIMTYSASKIVIEKNTVFENKTGGRNDGNGIDLDYDTSDSIVQYNYTYNNDGPGILVYDFNSDYNNTRNIIRYNLSHNDGKKSNMPNIAFGGYVHDIRVYNNSILGSNPNSNSPFQVWDWQGNNAKIENNIFYKNGTSGYIVNIWNSNTANLNFSNNNYYSPALGFRILWNNSYYNKLSDWQIKTGQDKYAVTIDPQWTSTGFKLLTTSPMYNKGKIVTSQILDYYGVAVPNNSLPEIGFSELIK